MAHVSISYTWADGSEVDCQVYVEDSFPDALDEARAQVTRMYRDVVPEVEAVDGSGEVQQP